MSVAGPSQLLPGNGSDCRLCPNGTSGSDGEHVLPKWYLTLLDQHAGPPSPYTIHGKLVKGKRKEKPLAAPNGHRRRWTLPVCPGCNKILSERFEAPVQTFDTRLEKDLWRASFTTDEWQTIGRWWAKTLLLWAHPDTTIKNVPQLADWAAPAKFKGGHPPYDWLLDGSPPPKDLHLFAYHCEPSPANVSGPKPALLSFPRAVVHGGGRTDAAYATSMSMPVLGIGLHLFWLPGARLKLAPLSNGSAADLLRGSFHGSITRLPAFHPSPLTVRSDNWDLHAGAPVEVSTENYLHGAFSPGPATGPEPPTASV